MRRLLRLSLLLSLCLSVSAQDMRKSITNEEVISMTKAGLKPDTIVMAIEQSHTNFDTSPSALITLKKASVSDAVLNAMLAASKKTPGAADADATSSSESVRSPGDPAAMQLITKALTAAAPMDKLTSINSTRSVSEVSQTNAGSSKTWTMERAVAYPDRIYMEFHGTAGPVAKLVITSEFAYTDSGSGKQDVPYAEDYRSDLKFELPYVAQHVSEFTFVTDGDETIGSQVCNKLRVRHENGREQVWSIDQSGKIVRRIGRSSSGEFSVENSDFRSIDGYSLPFHRRITDSSGTVREIHFTLFQMNPPTYVMDATLFATPKSEQSKPSYELPVPSQHSGLQNKPSYELPASNQNSGLSIRVLEETSVPYVQKLGGGPSTSCNISGGSNTTMSASTFGNNTYGTANTSTNLHLNCNSYDTSVNWQHVLNVMLVEASDGNAYIIACDRAWAWSKCVPLRVGDTFRARFTGRGIAVQALNTKGKETEPTYSILQSKVLR